MTLTTELFHRIDDAQAILRRGKVYKQVALYRRGAHVYAPVSGGYVRLLRAGQTADPNIAWDGIDAPSGVVLVRDVPVPEVA